jgi:hypothetical protein
MERKVSHHVPEEIIAPFLSRKLPAGGSSSEEVQDCSIAHTLDGAVKKKLGSFTRAPMQ